MMFLLRYRKVLLIALAVAAVLGWITVKINGAIADADRAGYQRATSENAKQVAKANADQEKRDAAARKAFQADEAKWIGERSEYESQIARLAARPPVVRVCKPAPADRREVPRAVAAAGIAPGAGQQRVDDLQAGRDIGPDLAGLLGEGERYRRRLIDLQARWPNCGDEVVSRDTTGDEPQ